MNSETIPAMGNEESLKRSAGHVRDAAETLLKTTIDETGAGWRKTRHALGRKAQAVKSNLSGRARDFAQDARELGGKGQHLVQQHPWTSMAVGAGLGLLAGLLIRRR